MYRPTNCPKPGCGAPMRLRLHRKERWMVCSKHKCRCLQAEWVSVYFKQKGEPCIAIHDVHRHPLHVSIRHIEPFRASFCVDRTHIHPPTRNRSGHTTRRVQLELALCFCWGTVHIAFTMSCRRPLHEF